MRRVDASGRGAGPPGGITLHPGPALATGPDDCETDDAETMTRYPQLAVVEGPQPGQTYALTTETTVVGRDPRSTVVVDDPQVSRRHARILERDGAWVVEDLGSTNGTFVNGERVETSQPLTDGDVIGLSNTILLSFRAAAEASRANSQGEDDRGERARSLDASPGGPTSGATAASVERVSLTPNEPAEGVELGRHQRDEPKTAWIWMAAAFIVLATIAVIALLLILQLVGRLPPILSG